MGNRLSISCYRIVLLKTKVNKTGTKWTQDILHESEGIFSTLMLNEDLSKLVPWPSTERCIVREVVRRGSQLAHVMDGKREYLSGDGPQRLLSQRPLQMSG